MNGVELALLATCAIVLLSCSNASPVNDQRLVEVSPEEIERERELLALLRQEMPESDDTPPSKRAQTFVRFGKRAQTFVRFGKRAQTFVRFGRSNPEQM
uniref:FMRFamide-related peptide FLP-16 n=1 Tax=Teladorsagia circumcincta TaxID=45464 RepID=Q68YT6_TELCI|nr:FMRFamide-related peptide FLP-16 precursor [Teladorsagia circumcincta]